MISLKNRVSAIKTLKDTFTFILSSIKSRFLGVTFLNLNAKFELSTLESGMDVGQGISVGPGKFIKKNKCRALNKRRAWKISRI